MTEQMAMAAQINEFYLSAFNHALIVVGVVFGLVGVVVPAVITLFQARQARHELNNLKTHISAEIELRVVSIKQDLLKEQSAAIAAFQERSESAMGELKSEINRARLGGDAGALHVQAASAQNLKAYFAAAKSALDAIPGYVACREYANMRVVCNIACNSMRSMSFSDIGRYMEEFTAAKDDAVQALDGANSNGEFTDIIRDIRGEFDELLNRRVAVAESV